MGAALAPAAAAASVGGGILSAYSQIQQGKDAVRTANRQQAYLNRQARQVLDQGEFEDAQLYEQGRQIVGAQRAGFAANGVDVNSGSASRVQESTMNQVAMDAEQVRRNAFNQAFGLITQGNEGIRQARADYRTRRLNAFSSLLTGGSQAYGNYRALS
ncbi:virion core protein, T7 gp14 family [Pseudomonas aeruginosa]|uniref:virion core protein, T7 gp14 family n=1 Tax=Pseudomonas aeruginosa TaxID=287 RepID=UPI003139F395